jgi:glycosyltransferase involved in cell wall biosynthesis
MLLSLVVCTYNRAELLRQCLSDVTGQLIRNDECELVVVNNNSTDNTAGVARLFAERFPRVRVVAEPNQGLSHARNRGWQAASGEYVAYIDDDCRVPSHWMATAQKIIRTVSPMVFGGPYVADIGSFRPRWFKDSYASFTLGEKARPIKANEFISGMNIVFRRSLLQSLGGFRPDLGMQGAEIGYGEEVELLRRVQATHAEGIIYYDPKFYVFNVVRPCKMTISWIMKSRFASGRYYYRQHKSVTPQVAGKILLLRRMVYTTRLLLADLVCALFLRDRSRYPYVQNYLIECVFPHVLMLGCLFEEYRNTSNSLGQR